MGCGKKKALSAVLLLTLMVSCVQMITHWRDEYQAKQASQMALSMTVPSTQATEPGIPRETESPETEPAQPASIWLPAPVEEADSYMEELGKKDLAALREVNPDVVGWIWIPGTYVNYPLMQGTDNDYYLNNTWNNIPSAYGSIFVECRNRGDLSDFNTIIYGHNMNNGSMFATLKNYAGNYYRRMFPYVYILTDDGVYRYEIFSTYTASVESITYQLNFQTLESREKFLNHALESGDYDSGIQPEATDRVITLSTCVGWGGYDSRRVVHARLKMMEVQSQ